MNLQFEATGVINATLSHGPNQPMKPTVPSRNSSSVFATTPLTVAYLFLARWSQATNLPRDVKVPIAYFFGEGQCLASRTSPGFWELFMQVTVRILITISLFLPLSASLPAAQTQPLQSKNGPNVPDREMMAPVTALARYMSHVDGVTMPPVFADHGVVIIEDFAPYVFHGKDAVALWNAGFRHHAGFLRDLKFTLGTAHDFDRRGDRIYFVLPTTWRGVYRNTRRFEEHGAWSFVLEESSGQWRIVAYGWGATDRQDWPVKR